MKKLVLTSLLLTICAVAAFAARQNAASNAGRPTVQRASLQPASHHSHKKHHKHSHKA